jgi:hypothetical protein
MFDQILTGEVAELMAPTGIIFSDQRTLLGRLAILPEPDSESPSFANWEIAERV